MSAIRWILAGFLLAALTPLPGQCQPNWFALGDGLNSFVWDVVQAGNGDLIVGGQFTTTANPSNPIALTNVARWDGSNWLPLGSGTNQPVLAVAVMPSGDVIAAGSFTQAGGVPANRIARWDVSQMQWLPLGSGVNAAVYDLRVQPSGDLIAAGSFTQAGGNSVQRIARWNGTTWSPYAPGINGAVRKLLRASNGDLVAVGLIPGFNNIARWDNAQWHAFGSGTTGGPNSGEIRAVAELSNGDLVVGGSFTQAGGVAAASVARWNGSSWQPMSNGLTNGVNNTEVLALTVLPGDILFAGGNFRDTVHGTNQVTLNYLAHFVSGDWYPSGPGLNSQVNTLTTLATGELAVGGGFGLAGGIIADRMVLLDPCPALATTIATSCFGPAGPLTLTAAGPPWVGQTYQASCSGYATGSVGWSVLGLTSPNTPLPLLTPIGLVNCTALASSDAVVTVVPVAGTATIGFAIPNDAEFGGITLYHQFAQVAFGPLSLSSSNGLELVVGY